MWETQNRSLKDEKIKRKRGKGEKGKFLGKIREL